MIPELRLGLVGLRFGRHLLRALTGLPGVRVRAIADRHATPDLMREVGAPEGAVLHADGVAMVREEHLDGVIIATSPRHRGPLLAACAAKRLPAFVEKPWAGNPTQARAFAELCAPIADRVTVGFSFRRHPAVRRLRAALDAELGPVWMANGSYAFHWDLGPEGWIWDADGGGGLLNENSCHLFDVLRHLIGEPAAVQAFLHNPRGRPSPELAAVTVRFHGGAVAALTLGGLGARACTDHPHLDLVTARGRATLRGRGHVWESVTWATHADGELRVHEAPPEQLGATRYTDALAEFVAGIRDGTPARLTIHDGIRMVDLADAIHTAARTGSTVEVPPS